MQSGNFRLSAHALEQIARRGLDRVQVERVLAKPQQECEARLGRTALQSRVDFPEGEYLSRAIVDRRADPPSVVTVYRTRFIAKYWRQE